MNVVPIAWAIGRPTIGGAGRLASRLHVYGNDRVPDAGGIVVASNHFSWLDPVVLGAGSPRILYYMAKMEAHRAPGLGALIRAFGCFPVRRGESDRDAVRTMRRIVAEGKALGLFVEGTRQRTGVPGEVQPGAAMVAIQEHVPVVPVAIHGTESWSLKRPARVSVAWGDPILFEGLPKGGKGYKLASAQIQHEIRRLWEWLVVLHEQGRPPGDPPSAGDLSTHE